MATKTIFLTRGTTYVTPSDWGAPWSVEVIGSGGRSGDAGISTQGEGGGGGGAYAKITNSDATINASQTVYFAIAAGGSGVSNTWLNVSTNAAPATTAAGCLAKGGANGNDGGTGAGGAGGPTATSVGSTKYAGGTGGNGYTGGSVGGGGGGGGAGCGCGMRLRRSSTSTNGSVSAMVWSTVLYITSSIL